MVVLKVALAQLEARLGWCVHAKTALARRGGAHARFEYQGQRLRQRTLGDAAWKGKARIYPSHKDV